MLSNYLYSMHSLRAVHDLALRTSKMERGTCGHSLHPRNDWLVNNGEWQSTGGKGA